MHPPTDRPAARVLLVLSLVSALLLAGCGADISNTGPQSGTLSMSGKIMGGQQPIGGASLQLYAAGSSGYSSASAALLTTTVSSDANGSFNITGDYSCSSVSTPVYLVARGGTPGGNGSPGNTASTLLATLGSCGNLSATTHIVLNEVTTIAAVWAMAPFMTGYDHIGAPSTNLIGLRNAFSMAANLASFDRGQSPGDAPAGATIPASEINTLANILAACVNSAGGSAGDTTACGHLFTYATNGSSVPTETAGAALNIALHPGANVANLYNLVAASGPFQPSLTSAPNDWTVAASFPVGAAAASDMAVDVSGNLWAVNTTALYELSPAGALLGTYTSMAGTRVALDPAGNIWVGAVGVSGNPTPMTLKKMAATLGTPVIYSYPAVDDNGPTYDFIGLAFDGFGNAWYTCGYCRGVSETNAAGAYVGSFSLTATFHATTVSIDPGENVWAGNLDSGKVSIFTQGGGAFGSSPYTCPGYGSTPNFITNDGSGNGWILGCGGLTRMSSTGTAVTLQRVSLGTNNGGLNGSMGVSIDGAGNAWVSNAVSATSGSLTEANSSVVAVSPSTGYVSGQLASPQGIALDGSGNVWLRNGTKATLTVFVGAGVPAVTPLALGVKNGTLGSQP